MGKPIIALATPPLKGALAIIRCSGDGIFDIANRLFDKKIPENIAKREILIREIRDENGNPIDHVVALVYKGPNTMTGEDVLEIIPHGSMVVVRQIVQAFCSFGGEYATRGEFSMRAFYNGKLDLVEAEAVNDMINATTAEAKNLAYRSLRGEASLLLKPIREGIADILALLEVGIDYPEYEDIEAPSNQKIAEKAYFLVGKVDELIANGREGQVIMDGVKVAIVGEPNVGKSSLLNALLDEDKAIVSDIPGTTRDVVEGDISIHGVPIHFLDTAGIRNSSDEIEKLGVALSEKSIEKADLVILLAEAKEKELSVREKEILESCQGKKVIICYNKDDLINEKEEGRLYVSAKNKEVEPLKEAIFDSLNLSEDAFTRTSLANERQIALLHQCKNALEEAASDAEEGKPLDIVSVNLQAAYNKIREITGEGATTDLSDEIFSRFCVGK